MQAPVAGSVCFFCWRQCHCVPDHRQVSLERVLRSVCWHARSCTTALVFARTAAQHNCYRTKGPRTFCYAAWSSLLSTQSEEKTGMPFWQVEGL